MGTGGDMNRLDDCIILLKYLEESGQQSLRKMQKETGIPFATIREYINPRVMTRKSWEEILNMRANKDAYSYYVSTLEEPDSSGAKINISKFKYLQYYGINYGYYVYWSDEKKRIYVERIKDHPQYWDLV